jgi:hypothetical protein
VPEDQQLAQRIGVALGIIVALLGMMLWARRRMAQLPPPEPGRPMPPKLFYKMKTQQRPGDSGEGDMEPGDGA